MLAALVAFRRIASMRRRFSVLKRPERVAPGEQPQPLALAEVQDSHRHLEQLVRGDLEQLVARVGVEDL